ncbi:MAG: hypothetical protein AB1Z98_16560, partial [Nannocystaceae bacterium]
MLARNAPYLPTRRRPSYAREVPADPPHPADPSVRADRPPAERAATRRARPLVIALGLTLAAVLTAALLQPSSRARTRCDPTAHRDAVWSQARAHALRESLRTSSVPTAGEIGDDLTQRLDDYADGWGQQFQHTCQDTTLDDPTRDLRMLCLLRQLEEVDALARVVGEGEP